MKKTDLAKNQGLAIAHRLKNSTKPNKPGSSNLVKTKKELADANPLLTSLLGKTKVKQINYIARLIT